MHTAVLRVQKILSKLSTETARTGHVYPKFRDNAAERVRRKNGEIFSNIEHVWQIKGVWVYGVKHEPDSVKRKTNERNQGTETDTAGNEKAGGHLPNFKREITTEIRSFRKSGILL